MNAALAAGRITVPIPDIKEVEDYDQIYGGPSFQYSSTYIRTDGKSARNTKQT
jgi:hypothetical protein